MAMLNSLWPSSVLDVSEDVAYVVAASQALNIKEFRLFRLAFGWWFGRDATDADVEKPFMRYLATEKAPPWVRHFTREIMQRVDSGCLDPRDFGLPATQPGNGGLDPRVRLALQVAHGIAWLVAIGVLAAGIG